jgi:hypothetical protein
MVTVPGPRKLVTTSAPSTPQKVQVAPVVSMWLMLRALSTHTLVLSLPMGLILGRPYWCTPTTYQRVLVWCTLLPQLRSRLHSRWASNSWEPGSRTNLHMHMQRGGYCKASWPRCTPQLNKAGWREETKRLEGGRVSALISLFVGCMPWRAVCR